MKMRSTIYTFCKAVFELDQIAEETQRCQSTITRELKGDTGKKSYGQTGK
jgi:IS30 family transposase